MAVTAFRSDAVILFIVQFRRVWFFYNINLLFRIWYTTHSIYASAFCRSTYGDGRLFASVSASTPEEDLQ